MRSVRIVFPLLLGLFALILAGCGRPPAAQYTLTINAEGQGSVLPASGGKFEAGTVVELTPTAQNGWAFAEWSGTDGGTVALDGTTYKIAMDRDKTITAVFVEFHDVNVTASPVEAGSVGVAIVSTRSQVPHGQTVRLTPQANAGYAFDHWEGDLTGTDSPAEFIVNGPMTITAVFVPVITGRVTGLSTLAGIPGVTLTYDGGTTITDAQGYFIIKNVTGPLTISLSAPAGAFDVVATPSSHTVTWPCEEVNFSVSWVQFGTSWGTFGTGDGQFSSPRCMAIDSAGNIYIADMRNNRVQKLTSSGAFIAKWGSLGSGDGQFNYPSGVAVDSAGFVYVADLLNNRIQKFTSDGAFVTKWGGSGSGDGQFASPYRVAVDSAGFVYVADSGNHRIQKFTSDGAFVTKWGGNGSGDGQLNNPYGVAVDPSGEYVYVADTNNNRVQKFTSSGAFVTKWGSYGAQNGQFYYPSGVTVDAAGNVFVADSDNNRIQKFSSSGAFLTKWGSYGTQSGQFDYPHHVAIDSNGNIYVADAENNRIQKFMPVN